MRNRARPSGPEPVGARARNSVLPAAVGRRWRRRVRSRGRKQRIARCGLLLIVGFLLPVMIEAKLKEFIEAGLRHVVMQPASALVSKRDAIYSLRKVVAIQRSLKRWANRRTD